MYLTGLAFSYIVNLNNEHPVQANLEDWWIRKGTSRIYIKSV